MYDLCSKDVCTHGVLGGGTSSDDLGVSADPAWSAFSVARRELALRTPPPTLHTHTHTHHTHTHTRTHARTHARTLRVQQLIWSVLKPPFSNAGLILIYEQQRMHVHACARTHTRTRTHVGTHACMHARTHALTHARSHTHTHTHTLTLSLSHTHT